MGLSSLVAMRRGTLSLLGYVAAAQLLSALSLAASDVPAGTRISPFMECVSAAPSASAQTQVELRGIVHEGKSIYLTFYDSTSKKWFTLAPGEQNETASLESFDLNTQSAVVRLNGNSVSVAFRKNLNSGDVRHAVEYAVSSSGHMIQPMPVVIPATSPSEAERLSSVAAELHQRQEQQKAAAALNIEIRS
jgi:hypothetical protein